MRQQDREGADVGIAVSQADGAARLIRLEGSLDIETAAALKEALRQAIAAAAPLGIDVTGVTDLDIAVWQLLYAARRDTRHKGLECTFTGRLPESAASFLAAAGLADPAAPE